VGVAGDHSGELLEVTAEQPQDDGSANVTFSTQRGRIAADLTVDENRVTTVPLKANSNMAFTGMYPLGQGFVLLPTEAAQACGNDRGVEAVIKPFVIARDLTQDSRQAKIIDFYPRTQDEVRLSFPSLFQWVLTRVKPERDQ